MKRKKLLSCLIIMLAVVLVSGAAVGCSGKIVDESSSGKDDVTVADQPSEDPQNGFVEEDGERYYYIDGVKQTDTVVGDDNEGYFYVGDDGAVDNGYCNGLNIDGVDWIVINGEAYHVQTESDKCLYYAAQMIGSCTDSSMTKEEKIKAAFDYIKANNAEGVLHDPPYPISNSDWPIVYANDIFVNGTGDCFSYGAAFAYCARAIGCAESYACNTGGHGWAEVENLVYDPEWSMHSNNYPYFAMTYEEECDVPYAAALKVDAEHKRMKIDIHSDFDTYFSE